MSENKVMFVGKRIDRALLLALLSAVCFFALNRFLPSAALCMALSFLIGSALYRLCRRLPPGARRKKRLRLQAADRCLNEALLTRAHDKLLLRVLPEGTRLLYRLPDSALSPQEALSLWRDAPPDHTLTLATTGPLPRQTVELAQRLKDPCVRLIDRSALLQLLAEDDRLPLSSPSHSAPLFSRWQRLLVRSPLSLPGGCLYALTLLAAYYFTGSIVCLFCALCLIALAALSSRARRAEKRP